MLSSNYLWTLESFLVFNYFKYGWYQHSNISLTSSYTIHPSFVTDAIPNMCLRILAVFLLVSAVSLLSFYPTVLVTLKPLTLYTLRKGLFLNNWNILKIIVSISTNLLSQFLLLHLPSLLYPTFVFSFCLCHLNCPFNFIVSIVG